MSKNCLGTHAPNPSLYFLLGKLLRFSRALLATNVRRMLRGFAGRLQERRQYLKNLNQERSDAERTARRRNRI